MYKFFIAIACGSVFSTAAFAQRSLNQISKMLHNTKEDKVLVVAHRGDWRNAPENSLNAIKRVIDMGVDIVELDIQKTKDGLLVLMHDKTLDRTTSGKGKVSDYTYDELKRFTLRTGSGTPTRQPIPTLEEAMLLVKGKIFVNIDKGYHHLQEIQEVLKRTGTTKQVIMKATESYTQVNQDFGPVLKQMYFMPMTNIHNDTAIHSAKEYHKVLGIKAVEVIYKDSLHIDARLTPLKELPVKLWFNSLWGGIDDELAVDEGNPDASWGWLIQKGATIIQTDRPQELIHYLKQINKY